jgi:hypothetical protein
MNDAVEILITDTSVIVRSEVVSFVLPEKYLMKLFISRIFKLIK